MTSIKNIRLILLALGTCVLGASCNATAGLGRDMRKLGDKIEDKAIEKKNY